MDDALDPDAIAWGCLILLIAMLLASCGVPRQVGVVGRILS